MGHSWVEIEISNLERTKSKKVKALVDIGTTLTTLSSELAEELEIKVIREDKVSTGAGLVNVGRGNAWIKVEDKEAPFDVWISDFVNKVLLGVVVLETLGFKVDPKTGKLEETPLPLY